MKIQYKSFVNENDAEFKWGRSLDTMFEPGSYTVEIDNIDVGIGLPDEKCSDEHYIVGNLVVTDNGTKGHKQDNRVIGQILTFTSRENKQTKIYTRTFANSMWSKWSSLVATDIFDNISTTEDMISTIAALLETVDELQCEVVAENLRTKVIENELKGATAATFDFTDGKVANYQSRRFAYPFKAGNKYLLKVLTDDNVATTYLSFRVEDGTALQNNLLTGNGPREGAFVCNEDCDYLYMTIQSNGVAIVYDVEVVNLSKNSIGALAYDIAKKDVRLTSIERDVMLLPTLDDFTTGYYLDNYGNYKSSEEYSATEKFFYIPSNTQLKIKARNFSNKNIVVVYDTEYNFLERFTGQGSEVDIEVDLEYDYPVYIRICLPIGYTDYFSISYDGKNFPRELSHLNQRVGCIESTTKSLGKPLTLDYEDFEIGNITIDKTGWAYYARDSRVRMKAGVTYHLFVGDIIALPDGVRAYLGYRVNGEYKVQSWFTGEWIATEEGDYKILLSGVTENTLSSKYDLLTDVRISGGERRYENALPIDADALSTLRVINHRGFNSEAPENTLPAFALSKLKGFRYVETDVHFTSDGVPVCIHDYTVERTSNGGNRRVDSMTFEEIRALDFGSWFSADYTGTQIPTFEEFLILCKELGLKPYAEIKGGNAETLRGLCDIVRLYGMEKHITYISSSMDSLNWLLDYNPKVRIGLLGNAYSEIYLSNLIALRDRGADVFADMQGTGVTDEVFMTLRNNGFEVEVWTTSLASTLAHKADGVTTDAALYWEYSGNRPVWYSNGKVWKE